MLIQPHAHILEAIKCANTSSPILDRDRLSQGSVKRTHAHTQLQTAGHSKTQLPPGHLITLMKKNLMQQFAEVTKTRSIDALYSGGV